MATPWAPPCRSCWRRATASYLSVTSGRRRTITSSEVPSAWPGLNGAYLWASDSLSCVVCKRADSIERREKSGMILYMNQDQASIAVESLVRINAAMSVRITFRASQPRKMLSGSSHRSRTAKSVVTSLSLSPICRLARTSTRSCKLGQTQADSCEFSSGRRTLESRAQA